MNGTVCLIMTINIASCKLNTEFMRGTFLPHMEIQILVPKLGKPTVSPQASNSGQQPKEDWMFSKLEASVALTLLANTVSHLLLTRPEWKLVLKTL